MDSRQPVFPSPEEIYPDRLTGTAEKAALPGRTWMWPAGLFLFALVPRALMALRDGSVCDDAYYYISVADALMQKDLATAFNYLNLNLYPVILLALHSLGLDWIAAGKLWGVIVSSLMVFPMFGWIRRVFDDRIAAVSCFLFAIHPDLIELGIEPIRGPTFWFFMALGLYFSWRAVTETKMWQFVATGLFSFLAIHTRSEGWILFAPIVLWAFFRDRQVSTRRWKPALGIGVCLAMTPLLLVLVNVTLLKDHNRWEWGRLSHFETCYQWVQNGFGLENQATSPESSAANTETGPPKTSAAEPPTRAVGAGNPFTDGRLQDYFERMFRNLEPVNLCLLIAGMIGWRHSLWKRDKLVLALTASGFLLAIWIRLSQIGDMNGRYFFPVYFLLVPFAALSFLWCLHKLERFGRRTFVSAKWQTAPSVLLAVTLTSVFLADALTTYHSTREEQDSLGRWLNKTYGPLDLVVVNLRALRVGYYTCGDKPVVSDTFFTPDTFYGPGGKPQMVILSTRLAPEDYQTHLQKTVARWKWKQIPPEELPETAADYLIFVDPLLLERTAAKSDGETIIRR